MAKELQVKEFSALPVADDGKTLLYIDGEVKQSSKNLSEMLTDEVNNKLDTTAFSTVSGSFLTAHQVIPSGKWENASDVVIANSATWEIETDWSDDISAASAYAYEQAVAQIPAPFDPTFLSGEIDKKLDKTFSSNFYPMNENPSGYLTSVDLSNYYTKNETSCKEEIEAALEEKQDKLTFSGENNTITAINSSAIGCGTCGDSNIFIVTPTTIQKEIADNSGKALFYKDDNGITYPVTNIIPTADNKTIFEFKGLENGSIINTINLISDPLSNDPISPSSISSNYLIVGTNYYTSVPLNVSGTYIYNGTYDEEETKHGGVFSIIVVSGDNFDLDIKSLYYNPTEPYYSAARPLIVNNEEVQWTIENNEYHIHLTINGITTIDHNEPSKNYSVAYGASLYSNEKYGDLFNTDAFALVYNLKYYNGLTFTATNNSEVELYCVNSKNRHYLNDEFCYEKWHDGPFTINKPIYIPTFANNEEKDQGYLHTCPIEDLGKSSEVNWKLTTITSYDTGNVLTASPDAITGLKINDRIYRFSINNFTYRNI